jgi:hypothetical protein
VVDLYCEVSQQHKLNRKILAFSVLHDQEAVRIYSVYLIIDRDQTSIYFYSIKKIDIMIDNGKDKWMTYKFMRNLYDIYSLIRFERLCLAVD